MAHKNIDSSFFMVSAIKDMVSIKRSIPPEYVLCGV